MKKFYTLYLLFLISIAAAQQLSIRVLTDVQTKSVMISAGIGNYTLYLDSVAVKVDTMAQVIQLTYNADSTIDVKSFERKIGTCKKVSLLALTTSGMMKVKSLSPESKPKQYEGDIEVTARNKSLRLINKINIEKYIAGVVETEAGRRSTKEYYKLQSILCRTYALANLRKHEADSFNLCDLVHCQAYKGRPDTKLIVEATDATKGLVVVDEDLNLITAVFHSNSGGQTINSEDIWSLSASYLRAKVDTFSLKMPNAKWEKRIPKKDWMNYLQTKYNFPVNDSILLNRAFNFSQANRTQTAINIDEYKIPLKSIRTDFSLKSTYFDILPDGEFLIFKGKGYGHGVGLSQEGAMRMALLGYSFKDIINFYYTKVNLVDLSILNFLRDE